MTFLSSVGCIFNTILFFLLALPDDFLQDTKQRYNSPCSLTSKISLADMQSELKMIPTYQLSPEDLRSCFSRRNVFRYKSISKFHTCTHRGFR